MDLCLERLNVVLCHTFCFDRIMHDDTSNTRSPKALGVIVRKKFPVIQKSDGHDGHLFFDCKTERSVLKPAYNRTIVVNSPFRKKCYTDAFVKVITGTHECTM